MATPARIFISHASKNFKVADEVRRRLEDLGQACWIAPRDIAPGRSYGEEISRAIEGCAAVVLLLTEEANASRAVANELEMAFRYQRVIIPLRIREVLPSQALAFFLNNTQWVDACHTPLKQRVAEIVPIVEAARQGAAPPPPAPERITLMGTLERKLEGLLRYKFVTLGVAVAVLAALGATTVYYSSQAAGRLEQEQALVDRDPAGFGLVSIQEQPQAGATGLTLTASVYTNLPNPPAAQVQWQGHARRPGQPVEPVDLSAVRVPAASGAQMTELRVAADTASLSVCMTATHPRSGARMTAVWDFVVANQGVQRARPPQLLPAAQVDCATERR